MCAQQPSPATDTADPRPQPGRADTPDGHSLPELGETGLLGSSPAMLRLFAAIRRVASTRATVLVHGETGTGKELVARALHQLSSRSRGPFVPVHCSAIPETLIEGELFGHTRGAFTGAARDRPGLIESAAGGTLFLDEISTLKPRVQVKLLRVLQDRRVQRLGSRTCTEIDFRLVAATNAHIEAMLRRGRLREDLYYRLDVIRLEIPPLRDRPADVVLLARHFWQRFVREHGLPPHAFPNELTPRLLAHGWPGNVRELENFIERAVILHPGEVPEAPLTTAPQASPPPQACTPTPPPRGAPAATLAEVERRHVLDVLSRSDGNRTRAARVLGIHRRTLHRKLKRYRTLDPLSG